MLPAFLLLHTTTNQGRKARRNGHIGKTVPFIQEQPGEAQHHCVIGRQEKTLLEESMALQSNSIKNPWGR
jgi:hypothetical protein